MKIDMGEVKRNQESLNASIKAMKSQLQSAQVSLAKLANNKESLEGTVRTAIDAKIKYHQLPLLQNYEGALDIMSKDYDAFITTFQSEVGESDSNAIINTDYLSELSAIFPGITQALSYIQRDTSSTYSDIADIISLTDPSTSVITTALTEAKQILTDTTKKISSFNELGTPGTFSEMMGQQNSELATLSSIQGPNYTAPNILSVYQNSDFVSKVKDNMAKDPAQYKVQLQNELAKEMENSKYNGNVAQDGNLMRNSLNVLKNVGMIASYTSTANVASKEALASLQKFQNGTWYGKAIKSTKSGHKTWKQVSGDVNRFKSVKSAKNTDEILNGTGTIARGTGARGVAKSIGYLGGSLALFDGGLTYLERKEQYGATSAAIDGVAHTGTALGSIYVGAVVGNVIPIPVVGTIAGAVAGYFVGGIANTLYDGFAHGKWNLDNFALW